MDIERLDAHDWARREKLLLELARHWLLVRRRRTATRWWWCVVSKRKVH